MIDGCLENESRWTLTQDYWLHTVIWSLDSRYMWLYTVAQASTHGCTNNTHLFPVQTLLSWVLTHCSLSFLIFHSCLHGAFSKPHLHPSCVYLKHGSDSANDKSNSVTTRTTLELINGGEVTHKDLPGKAAIFWFKKKKKRTTVDCSNGLEQCTSFPVCLALAPPCHQAMPGQRQKGRGCL